MAWLSPFVELSISKSRREMHELGEDITYARHGCREGALNSVYDLLESVREIFDILV